MLRVWNVCLGVLVGKTDHFVDVSPVTLRNLFGLGEIQIRTEASLVLPFFFFFFFFFFPPYPPRRKLPLPTANAMLFTRWFNVCQLRPASKLVQLSVVRQTRKVNTPIQPLPSPKQTQCSGFLRCGVPLIDILKPSFSLFKLQRELSVQRVKKTTRLGG